MIVPSWRTTVLISLIIGLTPVGARADAIDGNWCTDDGQHMSIDGPKLVTPGGTSMKGRYARHSFDYTVPDPEPGAGDAVALVLIHDDLLHATREGSTTVEPWRRCEFTS